MDLFEAIRSRRSIRKFKPDLIPDEDIRAIIQAATLAPNAGNSQMWRFLAVTNRDILAEIKEVILGKLDSFSEWPEAEPHRAGLRAAKGWSTFFTDAPVTIVVLGEPYVSAIDEVLEKRGWDRPAIDALRQ